VPDRFEFEGLCLRRPILDAAANARWVEKMGRGGTLLDLGANIAEVALRRRSQFDRVVCVEANPRTCEIARRRIAAAGVENISIVNRVVAPDGAPETYWVSNPSVASIGARARREKWSKRGNYFHVEAVPFSSLLAKHAPRCVKMDIEGGEFEVLREDQVAAHVLLEGVEYMVVEFHGRGSAVWRTIPAIIDRLRDRGLDLVNRDELEHRTRWSTMTLFFARRGSPASTASTAARRRRPAR